MATQKLPDFTTTVCGIPCGVVIEDKGGGFTLLDRHGYPAQWLERKMSLDDVVKLLQEIEDHGARQREEAALSQAEGDERLPALVRLLTGESNE